MPDTSESVTFAVFDLVRLLRLEIEAEIAAAGLPVTPAEARILSALRWIGPSRQHVLADRLGISRMNATDLIDRLEARGLVARTPDPDDRRAKQVALTDTAAPMLEATDAVVSQVRSYARGSLSDEDWELFRTVTQHMRGRLLERRAARCRAKDQT